MISQPSSGRGAALWTFLGCLLVILARPAALPAQVTHRSRHAGSSPRRGWTLCSGLLSPWS